MADDASSVFAPSSVLIGGFLSMLLLAWIAARLLGVRHRSWLSALIAGSSGWVLGALLSLAISRGHLEDLNSVVPLVFCVLATMAVTVALDLLHARTPRLRIASRHGLAPYLGLHGDPETAAAAAAAARAAMEEAGGVFVKLGQLLAGRADLLPVEARIEFGRLHETVAPADSDAVLALVQAELAAPVGDLFESFDPVPVAAASIAQAHAARLPGGTDVIVKVQRPGIDVVVADDLAVMGWLARMASRRTGWGQTYRVTAVAEEFAAALREELDFRIEARNVREARLALADQGAVVVPDVYDELSTRRVLVLERVAGVALSAGTGPAERPEDARKLGDALLRAIVAPMMTGERFHADPHPGNIRVLPDGRIGLLDFGAAGRLDAFEQASVVDIMLAVRRRDPALLLDAVREVAVVPPDLDERQLEHALARFLARNITPGRPPDTGMLTEMLKVFLTFGIALPAGTTTMFRALVTLQGSLEMLCPRYPVIDAAEELAGTTLVHRVTPQTLAEAGQQEILAALPTLRRLPRDIDRIVTQLRHGDLRLHTRVLGDPTDARLISRLVGEVVMVLTAATVGGLSIGLLALPGGPSVTAGLSMYDAFGYGGLVLSLILMLRVLVAVLRDDR